MKIQKVLILSLLFICVLTQNQEATQWGSVSATTMPINSSQSNIPGATNIMLHKIRIRNTGTFTNDYNYPNNTAFPHLFEIDFENTGTLPSSNIKRLRLWYDIDGVWDNGDERECNPSYLCQSNVNFDLSYSPNSFGSYNDRAYFGPNLNILLRTGDTFYLYLLADLSTNIIDNADIDTKVITYSLAVHRGDDLTVYNITTNIVSTPSLITTSVKATNLLIQNEPSLVNINDNFPLTVSARDRYNNIDKDYTGSVFFQATNVSPTPYLPPIAFISNTNTNPYTFQASDNGTRNFSSNSFKFLKQGTYKIRVSDGNLNEDWTSDISVSPEVHHFNITDTSSNSLSSYFITAGKTFKENSITNIMVSARNYVDAFVTDYQGSLYFDLENLSSTYQNTVPYDNNSSTLPTTSTTDRFQITNNGYTYIDGQDFKIYNAGVNKLRVYDEYGFKGEVNLTVVADLPNHFNIEQDTTLLAGQPIQYYIALVDQWNNTVDVSDTIEIMIYKGNERFYNHTFPTNSNLQNGSISFTKENDIKILEPGQYIIKIKNKDRPTITYQNTITVEMGAKYNLNIINNYIKPGETKEITMYYNNQYNETVTVQIKIFDIRGHLIKSFNPYSTTYGTHKLDVWRLKNNNNTEVAPGIYIVHSEDSKGNTSKQMVVFVK